MKRTALISIIVPIYNVEKYLKKCIDSIISQSYKNIEIILVDDGSPDQCGTLCDQYKEIDKRIIVIHKTNGGLSSARNAGLDVASGEYIGFVDSDDFIETTMYEEMLEMMQTYKCDIVECAVNNIYDDKINRYINEYNEVLDGKEALKKQLASNAKATYMPRISVWSKLFKKEFWKERRFPEGKIHEDYMLTCQALYYAKRVGLLKKGLYNHLLTNCNSIMNAKFGRKDLYLEIQYRERVYFLKNKNEIQLTKLAERAYYNLLLSLFWRCSVNNMEEKDYYLGIIKNEKKEIKKVVEGKRSFEYMLLWMNPNIYLKVRYFIMKMRKQ